MSSDSPPEPGKICVPGMRLSVSNDEYLPGAGTHEMNGYIYSTLCGIVRTQKDEQMTKALVVSVESQKTPSILPKPGDIVTARITVVNSRMVYCSILCIMSHVLSRPFKGIIKKDDIRHKDKETVDPYKSYRTGDIILARVLPITEVHCYHLSTAENELGVVIATAEGSPYDVNMIPISWSEMQCPKTMVKEKRKVARVIPETISASLDLTGKDDDKTEDEKKKTETAAESSVSN